MMKYSVYSLLCVCLLGALTACDPEISDPFITQSQAAVDERIIADYLSENKLTPQRSASGIY